MMLWAREKSPARRASSTISWSPEALSCCTRVWLAALESGKVRAAGLDVYADEPASNVALYSHPMVSCTPHIGAATVEAQKRIGQEIVEIIAAM